VPPDHYSPGEFFGDTAEEQRRGESLDRLLGEEEPDTGPGGYAEMDEPEPQDDEEPPDIDGDELERED
jgi:hypothetical protein